MQMMWRAHAAVDQIAQLAPISGWLRKRYERHFAHNRSANLFRGVYATFDEAQASAPANRPVGYDNPASAALYMERTRRVYATDYPVLFWLQKLLGAGHTKLFDLGGHIGVSYYAYRRLLTYPTALQWVVHDVPAVMTQGRHVAASKDLEGHLSFADQFEAANHMQVLMAQGSLQYLPDTLAERLAKLKTPPPHLLLNLTPLHERESYFTLQSVGTAFCPYRVSAMTAFLQSFEALGYSLVDQWENPEKHCRIPFHPAHSLERYHGFYLQQTPMRQSR
jgi:putative methyltransferase (TIGR04325 family)